MTKFAVSVIVAALVLVFSPALTPRGFFGSAPVAMADGPCSSLGNDFVATPRDTRCINGVNMRSRGYMKPDCLGPWPQPTSNPGVYEKGACGGWGRAAEYIAQARFLSRESSIGFNAASNTIEPDFEWETAIPNTKYRADILYFNHLGSAFGPIQVVEVKGTWNPSIRIVSGQIADYVHALNDLGMDAEPATLLSVYQDEFKIRLDPCRSGDPDRYETYRAEADPTPGVLRVEMISRDPCNNAADAKPATDHTEETIAEEDDLGLSLFGKRLSVGGDPHLTTFDGLHYDFQSAGEFDLASSTELNVDVQARLFPAGDSWSVLGPVAIRVGSHRVELRPDGSALIDGNAVSIDVGDTAEVDLASLSRGSDNTYYLILPADPTAAVLWYRFGAGGSSAGIDVPPGVSDLVGLLGNDNEDPYDDLSLRDGTALGAHPATSTIHGTFANSWRVSDTTSVFTYPPGESTATFTDLSFPTSIFTINDVSASLRSVAAEECTANGVAPGPAFDDCIVDLVATSNSDFAATASEAQPASVDVADLVADDNGELAVDFEQSVPHNFQVAEVTTDDATGTFAGPFSGTDAYSFYVPVLPPHVTGEVSFDLVALGDWSDPDPVESVRLSLNGVEAWNGEFSSANAPQALSSGFLTSGVPWTRYRVSVPFSDWQTELGGTFSAVNVDGLAGKAFGIDNIAIAVSIVPPQVFGLGALTTTAVSVSNGVPAAGAGNLETKASQDQYTFSLSATSSIFLHALSCVSGSTYPGWMITNDTTGAIVSTSGCADTRLNNLAAGNYRLTVSVINGNAGAYSFEVIVVPPAQLFDLGALPSTPVAVSNGIPAAGAGDLETVASEDDYRFSLTGAQSVYVDLGGGVNGGAYLPWILYNDSTGALVASRNGIVDGSTSPDSTISNLAAGTYRLVVSQNGVAGTYSLNLLTVPPPQVFDLGALATSAVSVSNGVPATGAGNLETKASQDQYTFSVASTSSIFLHALSCISGSTYPGWTIANNATGATVSTGSCADTRIDNLAAGTYRLTVSVINEGIGAYSFQLLVVPPAQVFDLGALPSTPVAVSNGVPAAGAGNLETLASQDEYRFSVTAGQSIYVDLGGGVNGGSYLPWTLYNVDTGALVGSRNGIVDGSTSPDSTISNLAAGTYRLVVSLNGLAGTYSLNLFTVPPAQVFGLGALSTSAVSVSNGVPTAGAGNLETKASQDQYTFTLASMSSIFLHALSCSGSTSQGWTLTNDATGVTVNTGGCADTRVNNLAAGTYRLTVTVINEAAGAYSFQLMVVPPPQVFDLGALPSTPVTISNGLPASGAGNLETVASQDEYRFSVTAGQSVYFDANNCVNGGGYLPWTVVNDATGAAITSGSCVDRTISSLAAGTYRLVVAYNGVAGTYSFKVFTIPPPQVFALGALTTSAVSVSNGVPAAGAGNLETKASQDQYNFSLASTNSILVHVQSCVAGYLNWILIDTSSGTQLANGSCADRRIEALTAGSYRIVVSVINEATGIYSFQLTVVAPAQVFDLGVLPSTPVSVSNGVPAAGAGNLETIASQDEYRFSVTTGQSVYFDANNCVNGGAYLPWTLINESTGATVTNGSCTDKTIANLTAGSYRLVVTYNGAGTYSFKLFTVPPPQVFDLSALSTSPVSVSNGFPAAGAGNLETKASQDQYTFSLSATSSIFLHALSCVSGSTYPGWMIVNDATGATVSTGSCADTRINNLSAGTYRLKITVISEGIGAYSFQLMVVPPAQVFDLGALPSTPVAVSNGVPATGAGNLETIASQDEYRFSVTAGQSIYIDLGRGVNGGAYLPWTLYNDTTGALVASRNGIVDGSTSPDSTITNLAAGTYRLVVSLNGLAGTYSLNLFTVPPPQVFDLGALSTSAVSVSNGAPAAGAGNLETKASQDQYTFSLTTTSSIFLHALSCVSGNTYAGWMIVNDASGATVSTGSCADTRINNLAAGTYRLKITVINEGIGTYSFQLMAVPPPQVFELGTLPSTPVTVSNGVPATGAGNLETIASQDEYRFSVTAGQSVYFHANNYVNGGGYLPWTLVNDSTGAVVASGTGSDRTIASLAVGTYRFVVAYNGVAGTYSFKLNTI